jgi:signal peptidase I
MKNEAVPENIARQTTEAYQIAAREAWRSAGADGLLRLTVISESMRPLLQPGDVAVVRTVDPKGLQPGDVIVVQRGEEWITHRLVAVDRQGWHTHGDNTRSLDATARADQIVGRVIAIERDGQMIDLQQPYWRAIDRQINRVQRAQLSVLVLARSIGGTLPSRIARGLAAVMSWPFQVVVRRLIRF